MRRTFGILGAIGLTLLGCDGEMEPDELGSEWARATTGTGITIRGSEVRREDYKFKARGVIFEGFQFPRDAMVACEPAPGQPPDWDFCERHLLAQAYYFGDALTLAKHDWHVNTVRLNLNQALLDPTSALYQKLDANGRKWGVKYLNQIERAVETARAQNLVVVLAIFSGRLERADNVYVDGKSLNDLNPERKLPTYRTKRAMETLVSRFKHDNEVLLEVFNEPYGSADIYVHGGSEDGITYAGLNHIIAAARANGETNPIIVQGLSGKITDYLLQHLDDNNIIFSSHPFLRDGDPNGSNDIWYDQFGNAARTRPVILTAWDATPKPKDGKNMWCYEDPRGIDLPNAFIRYVRVREIGLIGFAFDVPGSITKDFRRDPPDQPTSFGATCADGGHAGEVVQGLFTFYWGN